MKTIYDIKLVRDYVEGNDIEVIDIDELESDYNFMIDVINYTNDKHIYNLCSDEVKNNYEFIKFIINKFKDDINFICNIADEFLEKNTDPYTQIELLLIMRELTRNKEEDNKHFIIYSAKARAIYITKLCEIELFKSDCKDESMLNEIGEGFIIIKFEYNNNDIVLNYFAKNLINNIFFGEKKHDLENCIHEEFRSFKELTEYGINNYIINSLSKFDYELASYVCIHLDLIDNVIKEINRFKSNWNYYINTQKRKMYMKIFEEVHEYMCDFEYDFPYNETTILYSIAKELGIAKEMIKYDNSIAEDEYDFLLNSIKVNKKEMNFTEQRHYHNVKKIIMEKTDPTSNEDKNNEVHKEKQPTKSKILKIKFDNNK